MAAPVKIPRFPAVAARHILIALVVGIAGPFGPGPTNAQTPPNLVVVMADDLSTDALDALLAAGLMPNLQQRVIDVGIDFENAFVTDPICCPSRATFLRGQYAHNHGVLSNVSSDIGQLGITWPGWFPSGVEPGRNESTVATWLQASGYYTGHIGKYLNGYGVSAPEGVADPKTYIPPG